MDEKKIILMSKLAIEEKKWIKEDKKITSYYPEDYIYINNFKTRALVMSMTGIIMVISIFFKLQAGGGLPITAIDICVQYVIPYGCIMLAITLVYSLFSKGVYRKRYNLAQERMNGYKRNLRELEAYEVSKKKGGAKGETKRKYSNV